MSNFQPTLFSLERRRKVGLLEFENSPKITQLATNGARASAPGLCRRPVPCPEWALIVKERTTPVTALNIFILSGALRLVMDPPHKTGVVGRIMTPPKCLCPNIWNL